ncbi:hypothetical protein ACS0TY_026898 [Phlomoides rotata]
MEIAHIKAEKYKSKIRAIYNKHVKVRRFEKGDLVLRRVNALKPTCKLDPNWQGLYIFTKVLAGEAYELADEEERKLSRPWNISKLKKYYV